MIKMVFVQVDPFSTGSDLVPYRVQHFDADILLSYGQLLITVVCMVYAGINSAEVQACISSV
jgi:hypothetical protein